MALTWTRKVRLAVVLVAAAAGAAAAWVALKPREESAAWDGTGAATGEALVEVVRPPVLPGEPPATDDEWRRAAAAHAVLLAGRDAFWRLFDRADENGVDQTAWYKANRKLPNVVPFDDLRQSLVVRPVPGTNLVGVRFRVRPAKDAAVLANALCDAYAEGARADVERRWDKRLVTIRKARGNAANELEEVVRHIVWAEQTAGSAEMAARPAAPEQRRHTALSEERVVLVARLAEAAAARDRLVAARIHGDAPPAVAAAAARDATVAEARAALFRARLARVELDADPAQPTTAPATRPAASSEGAAARRREAACATLLDDALRAAREDAWSVVVREAEDRVDDAQRAVGWVDDLLKANHLGEWGVLPGMSYETGVVRRRVLETQIAGYDRDLEQLGRRDDDWSAPVRVISRAAE